MRTVLKLKSIYTYCLGHKLLYMLKDTDFVFLFSLLRVLGGASRSYWVVLVDRIYNSSVTPYDDGYLLHLQCKFL